MYIAMNRFAIAKDRKADFINVWKKRDSHLKGIPGFKSFKLLQGPDEEDGTVFVSHSVWESKEAFDAWRRSDHFKSSHAKAKAPQGTYLSHPKFEGFDVVLTQ